MQRGGMFLLRNPRAVIFTTRMATEIYVTYRARKYDRELDALREKYKRDQINATKEAARKMMLQIQEIIDNEKAISQQEKKELMEILRENNDWVWN